MGRQDKFSIAVSVSSFNETGTEYSFFTSLLGGGALRSQLQVGITKLGRQINGNGTWGPGLGAEESAESLLTPDPEPSRKNPSPCSLQRPTSGTVWSLSANWCHKAPEVPGKDVSSPKSLKSATVSLESQEETHVVSRAWT